MVQPQKRAVQWAHHPLHGKLILVPFLLKRRDELTNHFSNGLAARISYSRTVTSLLSWLTTLPQCRMSVKVPWLEEKYLTSDDGKGILFFLRGRGSTSCVGKFTASLKVAHSEIRSSLQLSLNYAQTFQSQIEVNSINELHRA